MARQHSTIDYTRLTFPSDALSIGRLRATEAKFPGDRNGFSQEEPAFFERDGNVADLTSMLYLERALAHKAFAAALGEPDPHPDRDESRGEMIRMLADSYKDYGLASGRKHTDQLVRDVEADAVAQAMEQRGKGR